MPEVGQPLTLHVGAAIRERRLDKYLHGRFQNLSRRFIQDAIKAGHVTVNDKPTRCSQKLKHRDKIDLVFPEPPNREIQPQNIPLNILYEDDDIIVVNKPPDLIVHPARGNKHGTLVNALAYHSKELSSGLGDYRPGIVHRLDRDTTGVMVATKNEPAQWRIAKQFERRQVNKTYLAIVHGTPQLRADRICVPIGLDPKTRERYAVRRSGGKESVTLYEVLESFLGFALLKLKPQTGRTHQLRVHLSYLKHPIVADGTYGGKFVYPWQLADTDPVAENPAITRCALHAWRLEFEHPTTERTVQFEAPIPEDMQRMLDLLRKYRSIG